LAIQRKEILPGIHLYILHQRQDHPGYTLDHHVWLTPSPAGDVKPGQIHISRPENRRGNEMCWLQLRASIGPDGDGPVG
jgi:hypothetical protein